MKYKFIFSDLILFHNIINNNIEIDLPHYVTRIVPQDIKNVTRNTFSTLEGNDNLKFKCKILPKINAFKNNFFVRTMNYWNELPYIVREIKSSDKFSVALKDHLWRILGFEPD